MSGGIAFFMGTSRALTTHESRVTNKIPTFLIVADILCVMIQLFGKNACNTEEVVRAFYISLASFFVHSYTSMVVVGSPS